MQINEIFSSIQGESSYMGMPCLFIRLTGCNLRCTWCDTEYAFYEGKEVTVDELLSIVASSGIKLVEITGGEPLLQDEVPELVDKLLNAGYEVLIETSGSVDIGKVNKNAVKIMDIKCPASGMSSKNDWRNIDKLQPNDEVKFVIGDRGDYDWANKIIRKTKLEEKVNILFSPVHDTMDAAELAGWILEDKINVRMQLQLHKFIWDPEMKGV